MIETEIRLYGDHDRADQHLSGKHNPQSFQTNGNVTPVSSRSSFEQPSTEYGPKPPRRSYSHGQPELANARKESSVLEFRGGISDRPVSHVERANYSQILLETTKAVPEEEELTSGPSLSVAATSYVGPVESKSCEAHPPEQPEYDGALGGVFAEKHKRKYSQVDSISLTQADKEKVLKLSPEKIHELTSAPESLLLRPLPRDPEKLLPASVSTHAKLGRISISDSDGHKSERVRSRPQGLLVRPKPDSIEPDRTSPRSFGALAFACGTSALRPSILARALSTPAAMKRPHSPRRHSKLQQPDKTEKDLSTPLHLDISRGLRSPNVEPGLQSPMPPSSLPLPPLSIPTYLQLELSSHRPSRPYIHGYATSDFPYESSHVKIERLLNFLLLPPQLEGVLWFGTLACFDAWLYTFTILPLRLLKSFYILTQSRAMNLMSEARYVSTFIYNGSGRMWRRRRTRGISESKPTEPNLANDESITLRDRSKYQRNHRKTKSIPSTLLPDDKADILKGALIICTCMILLRLDASRMYHWIRGQAAIKLYVIYNVLEVCDRLFSAIGQDVLECLFSRETLERKPDGHSKILRPFWLFMLALIYTVIHTTALFYQVITLNVAVNSYSNALITLLMSNQFVEIKSTVFKKFEKENLFQLTCADVVERFQLWLMLTIIASRNIVETGGLSMGLSALSNPLSPTSGLSATNSSVPGTPPLSSSSILPSSFTLVPAMLSSWTAYAPAVGHVLGPFLAVLGSEMLVDWLKHAYISKFNNTRPTIYGRFLDVLAKDYYTNAFAEQNLTKRLGLPVIPLSCLFIRASVQTYYMFMAVWVPAAIPSSSTSLATIHQQFTASRASTPTSTVTAISHRFDDLLRQIPAVISSSRMFTNFTTILIFLLVFLVLLACKLVLGMVLLSFSRARYRSMKEREKAPDYHIPGGKRVGGWGVVEVDDDKRRWIYADDAAGLRALKEREEKDKVKRERGTGEGFDKVKRYEMVAKRIW